jgi:hypothetical protein
MTDALITAIGPDTSWGRECDWPIVFLRVRCSICIGSRILILLIKLFVVAFVCRSIVRCSIVRCSIVRCSIVRCSIVSCSIVRCSIPHSTLTSSIPTNLARQHVRKHSRVSMTTLSTFMLLTVHYVAEQYRERIVVAVMVTRTGQNVTLYVSCHLMGFFDTHRISHYITCFSSSVNVIH